jgi:hypothetical protein
METLLTQNERSHCFQPRKCNNEFVRGAQAPLYRASGG